MAPKRSTRVTKATVKTTRKVVQETVEFSIVKEKDAAPREKKVVDILVQEKTELAQPPTKPFEGEEREQEETQNEEETQEETVEEETTAEKEKDDQPSKEEPTQLEREKIEETGRTKTPRKRRKKASGRELGGFGEKKRGYKRYVFRVLKQVHPELGVSSMAMTVIDSLVKDMCDRLVEEASNLSKYSGKATMSAREIQAAVQFVLPGDLGRHALAEGNKAVSNYVAADKGAS